MLRIPFHNLLETLQGAILHRLDGTFRALQQPSDLTTTQIGKEAQGQHPLLLVSQLTKSKLQVNTLGDHRDIILTTLVNQFIARSEWGCDNPLAPLVTKQEVRGDRIDPAQEGFLITVLKTRDPTNHFDKDLLSQILS